MQNSKQRFTTRVENYLKSRPKYPPQIVPTLHQYCNLSSQSTIADIGSGTGLLAELFLENRNLVYGVEPNEAMRHSGEASLSQYPHFISVNGSAEETNLATGSCDFIVAGQAFHWFDPKRTRQEFKRILKPGGWVALIWNILPESETGFNADYEALFSTYGVDYQGGSRQQSEPSRVLPFFEDRPVQQFRFANPSELPANDFQSRVFSSSQTPEPGHPNYKNMQQAVEVLFDRYQTNGLITIPYETLVYIGQFSTSG